MTLSVWLTEKLGKRMLLLVVLGLAGWMVFVMACDEADRLFRPYVATVNGSKIYRDEYQACLAKKIKLLPQEFRNQPEYVKKFEEEVLEGLIEEKLMLMRAAELNLSVSDSELEQKIEEIRRDYGDDFTGLFTQENIRYEDWKREFRKEMLLQKLVEKDVNARVKISEGEIEKYFQEHRSRYNSDLRVRVSQIMVRDRVAAEKAAQRLEAGEDFAKVAAEVSLGPEAAHGGDLGYVTRWVMPEPLDHTIFKMPVQQISPIVQSSYGFHIFKVTAIQPARERTLSEVREDVIRDLRMEREETDYRVWLAELKQKAVIKKGPLPEKNDKKKRRI